MRITKQQAAQFRKEAKLARCKLGEREFLRVCHVAECEAGIDLDELEGGE